MSEKIEPVVWVMTRYLVDGETEKPCHTRVVSEIEHAEALRASFMAGVEAAAKACENERLIDPTDLPMDKGYDMAIGHAVRAIRAIKYPEPK